MRRKARVTANHRWSGEDGVSLVEVLVAVVLLSTAFIALAQVATNGLFSLRSTADRTAAIGLATQAVETTRTLEWDRLAMTQVPHATRCGTLISIDQAASLNENLLCAPGGEVDLDLPYWGPTGSFELRTYVTSIAGFNNARRATAVVTWSDRGQTREVRNSTVIAQVERGT